LLTKKIGRSEVQRVKKVEGDPEDYFQRSDGAIHKLKKTRNELENQMSNNSMTESRREMYFGI